MVKHLRPPEPSAILNVLLLFCEGDTTLYTRQGTLPDMDCSITCDSSQNEPRCQGLGDTIVTGEQAQYSDVASWQIKLNSDLHWCPTWAGIPHLGIEHKDIKLSHIISIEGGCIISY